MIFLTIDKLNNHFSSILYVNMHEPYINTANTDDKHDMFYVLKCPQSTSNCCNIYILYKNT